MTSRPRIGLVGPRRLRQGLGPFLARHLEAAGAEVAAFACRSPASIAAGRAALASVLGRELPGFVGAAALAEQELDALVVASPIGAHAEALEAALRARLPVLCEKPLVWVGAETAAHAEALCARFARAGLLLRVDLPWPFTLASYARLCPAATLPPLERFDMLLSPASGGTLMLVDALPHALSLLQALAPDPAAELREPSVAWTGSERVEIRFVWASAAGPVVSRIRLARCAGVPRPAGYGLNGLWARRRVELPAYRQYLTTDTSEIRVPDPLAALCADFCGELRVGARPKFDLPAPQRLRMLALLVEASDVDP